MNPALTLWAIRLCVTFVVVAGLVGAGYVKGRAAGKAAGIEALQAHLAADAALAVAASEDARQQEQAHAQALADVAQQYEQDKQDAQDNHARLVADLRRGTVRLQDHWTCKASVPGAESGTGIADAGTDLRQAGAADLIAAADQCDAQVRGLQAVTVADRQ